LIYLIDPRALTRECLSRCLQSLGFTDLVALATTESKIASSASPNLVVLNLAGHPLQGATFCRTIQAARRRFPTVPLMILADRDSPETAKEAIGLGARGYIHTALDLSVVAAALRLVLAGGIFVPVTSRDDLKPAEQAHEDADPAYPSHTLLTPREMEVLRRLEQGKTNKEIAHELRMQESTVKSHVRQMKHKTRLRNRVELALRAASLLAARN
jgi:DNA-binding NarL/FixJ family response regulator